LRQIGCLPFSLVVVFGLLGLFSLDWGWG